MENEIWNAAIEAAASFVESHIVYTYAKKKLQPVKADRKQHWRSTNPPRIIYAEAIRKLKRNGI